ncbi:MAG: hypothetical protein U0872_02755 [Planctomycetaceae bacterium]
MNLPSAKFLTLTARHGRLLLVTACCLAWWTAAGWGQEKPAEPQPDPERDAIVRMLDLAWSGDQSAADAVREYYDSAKSQVNDPARWYYAYGIAQLKLKRYAGASQAFKTAIKSSSQLPISAWKGLIWAELSQRHYEPGLGHLEAFGKSLVPAQNAGNDQEVEAAAVWIGQSLGGLDKIITAPKVRQRLAETEAELQAAWPADLRDEAQSGREYADMLYAELTEDLKKATEQAKSAEEQTKQAKQKQLADKSVEAGKQREELKKSAEDLEKQAKERLEQVDKQLERLERDYGYLQTRAIGPAIDLGRAESDDAVTGHRLRNAGREFGENAGANHAWTVSAGV